MDNCKSFEALVGDGKFYPFHCLGNNKFELNYSIYEAVEDPDDGYRSCLGAINRAFKDDGYHDTVARVTVTLVREHHKTDYDSEYAWEVYKLTDKDGHVWLTFGTDNIDDYYPGFIFDYQPKPPKDDPA
jgi:hypothetical protein